jgi:hypothetical protein
MWTSRFRQLPVFEKHAKVNVETSNNTTESPLTFHAVARAPPSLAPLALRILRASQLATPLAPNFAETWNHIGVIPGPNGHEVQVEKLSLKLAQKL